jgi:hypothetical protein
MTSVALAATSHDTEGRLTPAIARSGDLLRELFAGIAINVTHSTHPGVVAAMRDRLGAQVIVHPENEATIGRARRDAVRLALEFPAPAILYCDFDHLIRWAEANPEELRATLETQPEAAFLVIGRSARAFAAEPQRLEETEILVNRVYTKMTGRGWDLMFAVRRMSRAAAEEIVRSAKEESVVNDVEWPLLAERAGFSLGYAAADGLYYRTMEEFGAPADSGDASVENWIKRIELAAQHVKAMRPFLRR